LGILSITDLVTCKVRFLIVFTILEEILDKKDWDRNAPKPKFIKTASDSYWDFPMFRYQKQSRFMNYEVRMVDALSISKPCMLLPCPSRNKHFNSTYNASHQAIRFFVVKYDKVDREKNETMTTSSLTYRESNDLYRRLREDTEGRRDYFDDTRLRGQPIVLDNVDEMGAEEDNGEDGSSSDTSDNSRYSEDST